MGGLYGGNRALWIPGRVSRRRHSIAGGMDHMALSAEQKFVPFDGQPSHGWD
jgi:hypothetical protein